LLIPNDKFYQLQSHQKSGISERGDQRIFKCPLGSIQEDWTAHPESSKEAPSRGDSGD
ncbi:hypothetical protein P7K49_007476, partial [Saguinus oedipus]